MNNPWVGREGCTECVPTSKAADLATERSGGIVCGNGTTVYRRAGSTKAVDISVDPFVVVGGDERRRSFEATEGRNEDGR